ncbi:hypothetical protein FPHYL_13138 [Fusarium phyllophilum]|uniref:C2H2-type domain-containing protein n=1 Tax=Fusarium phyllophilum TaxID=47803 RepID=A0A8H5MPV8_9HYPO|nr:hypothetical protein FPHYL_13138 [Fusarium phyllophilum]
MTDIAAYISTRWVRHVRTRDRQQRESRDSLGTCEQSHCSECGSPLEDEDSHCFHCRPQRRSSLVSEVKTIYACLVKVEETCTQIEQSPSRNSERNPDLNHEEWMTLQAGHDMLLHQKKYEYPIGSCSSLQLRNFRKVAHDHSFQSRSLRRFSDCLLPLLKREQDLESAQQWVETMRLSSSLIEILGKNEVLFVHEEQALTDIIEEIEAILSRLKLWFRCRYDDLNREKDVTEEQTIVKPVFEFPNNIRHTCTTMPWTILPALLVLWGVCWMFIIGSSQPEHEWRNAVDPMISPVPATYDFYADFHGIGIEEGLQGSVADDFDNRGYLSQDTLEELWPGDVQLMNDLIHPLNFAQDTPQDPNFLIPDMMSRGDSESLELTAQDTAEILSATPMKDSTLTACINTGNGVEREATVSADSRSEETKSRFVCPDCGQTFARSFTLSRHQTEKHKDASGLEGSFLCPNTGCKRSNEKPFKRRAHLTRHLENCKHKQEDLSRRGDQSCPRSASASTSASASIQHRQDVGPDEAIRVNGARKRPRAEDDEGLNDEFLLAEMVKKYKKMEKEIKEKQDNLQALGKTIQMLKGSLRNS